MGVDIRHDTLQLQVITDDGAPFFHPIKELRLYNYTNPEDSSAILAKTNLTKQATPHEY
jgi:hypothetical protein